MNRGSGHRSYQLRRTLGCLLLLAAACAPEDDYSIRPPTGGAPVRPPAGRSGSAAEPAAGSGVTAGMPAAGRPGAGTGASGAGAGAGAGASGRGGTGSPLGGGGGESPPDGGIQPQFDAGVEPDRNKVQPGRICERLAAVQCAGEAFCCTDPNRTYAACRSAQLEACSMDLQFDAIARNMITGFSAANAESALDRFEQLASQCDPSIASFGESPEGLRGMLQGTLAPEASCKPPAGIPSVAAYGAALASCAQLETHACLFSGSGPVAAPTSAVCAPHGDAGATCYVDTNCKLGLYCENPNEKYSMGRCTARKAVGAACTAGPQCETLFCKSRRCVASSSQAAYCLQD